MAASLAPDTLPAASELTIAPEAAGPLQDAVRVATVAPLPLELGSVEFTDDGRVTAGDPQRALRFSFLYKGLPFHGELAQTTDSKLQMVGNFGKMPFTAELPDGRRTVRQLILDSKGGRQASFRVSQAQDIELTFEVATPHPRTPVSLVATVAAALLSARPDIEAMTDALSSRYRAPVSPC